MRGCFFAVVAVFLLVFGTASMIYGQATRSAFIFVGFADPLPVDNLLPSRLTTRIISGQVKIFGDCAL